MTTPILEITEVSPGLVNPYLIVNSAIRKLESAFTGSLDINLGAASHTLSNSDFFAYCIFVAKSNTVARTITVPQKLRVFYVINSGTFILSVTRGSTTHSIDIGAAAAFYTDGTINGLIRVAGAGAGGGLTGFLSQYNTAAPNATIPVSVILADGIAASIDVALAPKGDGALSLSLPDSTIAGGNKRGRYAVDLQLRRYSASQVAAGDYSYVAGRGNAASGEGSFSLGRLASDHGVAGRLAFAGGAYSTTAPGTAQISFVCLMANTSSATVTPATSGGLAPAANTQLTLINNSLIRFTVEVVARDSSGTFIDDCKIWVLSGVIRRKANAASTALLGAVSKTLIYADASAATWDVDAVADTSIGCLKINVTGESAKAIHWVCKVETAEVG